MSYHVKLQHFEGPLDLLLFLIKKNEINIYDIPIALITKQYLEYIKLMQSLDLEIASEFILMAATLIRIKAQMLLPKPALSEINEEIEDPRQELVAQLLEYKKYKEIAGSLARRENFQRLLFPRGMTDSFADDGSLTVPRMGEVTLFDLLAAFHQAMQRLKTTQPQRIEIPTVSLEEQVDFILRRLQEKDQLTFCELVQDITERVVLVTTFIALLELMRRQEVVIKQKQVFDQIWIFRVHLQN
ncbi:segregation/condensation protein A [candidate division KSB1 bacterium]|nr:segregation/condensation protein A [bacterium]RKY84672.1 MAG: segregation/condensation protein A [candidate division KSB1 bacterium]RKY87864.1 MAG: segregation/condensation protein A [candidate division KSB1 bacterium]